MSLNTIGPFKSSCASVSFSPNGRLIAGAAQSGWATVWNAETGEKLFSVEAHPGGARRANFSPDGGMLATCGWDETAAVWNVPDGSLRYRTDKQGLALSDVKFSARRQTAHHLDRFPPRLAKAGRDQTLAG